MHRRISIGLAALLVFPLGACSEAPKEPRRTACDEPNVLLYVVDTIRADSLKCYGNTVVHTPAIDAPAREGTLFETAVAPSSWTRASVGSLLTGLYPDVHGAEGRDDSLPEGVVSLSELFSERGYATAAVVANPNVGSFYGFDQGFRSYVQLYKRRDKGHIDSRENIVPSDQVNDYLMKWLDQVDCPFFLFVMTIDPHYPYAPPQAFDSYGNEYSARVDGDPLAIIRDDLNSADRMRLRNLYRG